MLSGNREFLWQERHSSFATKGEADAEVLEILELYRQIFEEYLAVPVIKGNKSEREKFAGALYPTKVEAFITNTGRGIQGTTSHCLGQNFARMFEIYFENEKGERLLVWQNSWAYTTRTSDAFLKLCILCEEGTLAESDSRDNYSPGWKYSHWEMKRVPLRIEIGRRDLANNQARAVRRDNGSKMDIYNFNLVEEVKKLLDNIPQNMFDVAKQKRDECIQVVHTWDEFIQTLNLVKDDLISLV
ncbi:hypothetical protein OROMI_019428 [Orobanche minor]